jgi:hypothetical protein
LASISENYEALQQTWSEAKRATKDTEMRARIVGVAAQMKDFDYFFGLELGRKCFSIADNLSRSLQASTISACEGQEVVKYHSKPFNPCDVMRWFAETTDGYTVSYTSRYCTARTSARRW